MNVNLKNIVFKTSEKNKVYVNCDADIILEDFRFTISNLAIFFFPTKIYFPKDYRNKLYFQSDHLESELYSVARSEFEWYMKYYEYFKSRQLYRIKVDYLRNVNYLKRLSEERSLKCRECLKNLSCDFCKYNKIIDPPKHNFNERIHKIDEYFKNLNLSVEKYEFREKDLVIEFSKIEHQFKIMKVVSLIIDDADDEEIFKIPKEISNDQIEKSLKDRMMKELNLGDKND